MLVGWSQSTVSWDTFDASAPLNTSDDFGTYARGITVASSNYNNTADDLGGDSLAKGAVGTWDVTASLQAWSAGAANNGWAFIGTTDNGWDAYTSEFATVGSRPVLSGTFTPVPEPTTTALLGLGGLALILRRRM